MKKWLGFISALLALLVVSNIFLLFRLNEIKRAIAPGESSAFKKEYVGTWEYSYGVSSGDGEELVIKPDGSFEKTVWRSYGDENLYIDVCYVGYLEGDSMIYTGAYAPTREDYAQEKHFTDVSDLTYQDYSMFTTIVRYGRDAIEERTYNDRATQYTRQK